MLTLVGDAGVCMGVEASTGKGTIYLGGSAETNQLYFRQ